MSDFTGDQALLAVIDELAVTSTWSRRRLEMWCRIARVIARRRRLPLTDPILAEMLKAAVEVSTATAGRTGSPDEFVALFDPPSR